MFDLLIKLCIELLELTSLGEYWDVVKIVFKEPRGFQEVLRLSRMICLGTDAT